MLIGALPFPRFEYGTRGNHSLQGPRKRGPSDRRPFSEPADLLGQGREDGGFGNILGIRRSEITSLAMCQKISTKTPDVV